MARNQRIFYACQAVAITTRGLGRVARDNIVQGVQSVGMSSTFTLDQVFELGQIEIYENIEQIADVEVTIEKVIDGYNLIYDLATDGSCKTDLVAASKSRCDVLVAIYDDGVSHATGVPRNVCYNSGMFVSSVAYSYTVDGSATESVTLVGNDRFWHNIGQSTASAAANYAPFVDSAGNKGQVIALAPTGIWSSGSLVHNPTYAFNSGLDSPKSGVVRKVDVDLANSTLPYVVKSQRGDDSGFAYGGAHVQSISVSTDFGQENIQELGRFGPYHRFATFPIEVTCEFEVIATSGDLVNVSGNAPNLSNETIIVKDGAGTVLNLGTKNKLASVSYSGGDTGGGNATITYSYSNFNVLTVQGGSNKVFDATEEVIAGTLGGGS